MIVVYGIMYFAYQTYQTDMPTVYNELEVIPEEEEDTIEKAKRELLRISQELDAKEKDLIEQRKQIDAELERLRQTRVSFQ